MRIKGSIRTYSWLFTAIAIAVLSSCRKTYDPVPEHLYNMYPIEEGRYKIFYAIDSNFASINGREGRTFYKKEETGTSEPDLMGRSVNRLYIYEATDSTDSTGTPLLDFQYKELWTEYKDEYFAERIEGNTRYLALKLPPVLGTSWNGNLYNSEGAAVYEVTSQDTTITVQGVTYKNCVFLLKKPYRLIQFNELYIREYSYEIYAPGIGRIVRHEDYLEIQNPGPGQDIIEEKSVYLHEELVSHN